MYVLLGPAAEGLGAAALVHQVYHDAEYDEEDQDTDVAAVGEHGDQTVLIADQRLNRLPGGKLGVEQCADQAAEEQGGVNLLADERQHDGDDRRQERPEGGGEGRRRGDRLVFIYEGGQWGVLKRDAEDNQQHDKDTKLNEVRYAGAFLFHKCDLPPLILISLSYLFCKGLSRFRFFSENAILNKL